MKLTLLMLGITVLVPQEKSQDSKKKADDRVKEFKAKFRKAKTATDRVAAIEQLAEMSHPKILAELSKYLSRYDLDVSRSVAKSMAKYTKNARAAQRLIQVASKEIDPDLASLYLKSAGEIKDRRTAKMLVSFFKDERLVVSGAAIVACGQIKSRETIRPLIDLAVELDKIDKKSGASGQPTLPGLPKGSNTTFVEQLKRKKELSPKVFAALCAITGEKFKKGAEWQEWWKKNGAKFKEPSD